MGRSFACRRGSAGFPETWRQDERAIAGRDRSQKSGFNFRKGTFAALAQDCGFRATPRSRSAWRYRGRDWKEHNSVRAPTRFSEPALPFRLWLVCRAFTRQEMAGERTKLKGSYSNTPTSSSPSCGQRNISVRADYVPPSWRKPNHRWVRPQRLLFLSATFRRHWRGCQPSAGRGGHRQWTRAHNNRPSCAHTLSGSSI